MPVIRRTLEVLKPDAVQKDCNKRGYTVRETATYSGVSVWQVRQWIQSRELKPAVIGNKHILDKATIDRLLDGLFKAAA